MQSVSSRSKLIIAVVLSLCFILVLAFAIGTAAGSTKVTAEPTASPPGVRLLWTGAMRPVATPKSTTAPHRSALKAPTRFPRSDPPEVAPAPAGSVRARVLAAWPGSDAWADHVVSHESGYNPRQYGGMFNGDCCWGLWQFSLGTYHSNGGSGNPINDSVEEQTRVAWRTFVSSGSSPWAATAPWYVPPQHG